jgi:uncharacterized protein YbjT (DUF2867 family)
MSQSLNRIVLVAGGTGKQGGATIRHLLESRRVRVRVLTRNPNSDKAKRLAAQGVELARGDFDESHTLAAALSGVSAAFSVQSDNALEVRRGKAFADAVREAGTPHLVYSSLDGAERKSGVPHYESKWHIEEHIRELALPATILRPVAFMENLLMPALPRSVFIGILRAALGRSKRLQLVSTSDVGWFAARALEEPNQYVGRTIALAGDELNVDEILDAYLKVEGRAPRPFPTPRFALRLLPRDLSSMLCWFAEHGFEANIPELRRKHPGLMSFASCLEAARSKGDAIRAFQDSIERPAP